MKIILKMVLVCFVINCGSAVNAQFNTLTRTLKITKEKNTAQHSEVMDKSTEVPKKTKVKPSLKTNVFNLQMEMDSLKKWIKESRIKKGDVDRLNWSRLKDSAIALLKNEGTKNFQNNTAPKKQDLSEIKKATILKSKFNFPLHGELQISSKFGKRNHPISQRKKMHNGTDFKAHYENVFSVLDGVVTEAGWDSKGGGNFIKIKHLNSFVTSYLHLSEKYYKVGEEVAAGSIIARSGNSGNSTGPHLHFAVQERGKFINPISFLYDLIKANNLIATYYEK